MKGDLIVHVIHVAGTWMKELGIYGLSRGNLLYGVMAGKCTLEILPLNVRALDILGRLKQRIRNYWGCQPPIKLDQVGWFTKVQGS